jgi:hypothetical protein
VLAIAAQSVHFFVALPSAAAAAALATVFVVCLLVRKRDARWVFDQLRLAVRNHPVLVASFVASAIVVALAAARPCKVEDTENYHAQVLRWTEAARLVPGLALVHGRLGFNSLWFPLEALFSFAFLSNGPMPLVNTATFLLGGLYLFRHALSAAPPSLRANLAQAALIRTLQLGSSSRAVRARIYRR